MGNTTILRFPSERLDEIREDPEGLHEDLCSQLRTGSISLWDAQHHHLGETRLFAGGEVICFFNRSSRGAVDELWGKLRSALSDHPDNGEAVEGSSVLVELNHDLSETIEKAQPAELARDLLSVLSAVPMESVRAGGVFVVGRLPGTNTELDVLFDQLVRDHSY